MVARRAERLALSFSEIYRKESIIARSKGKANVGDDEDKGDGEDRQEVAVRRMGRRSAFSFLEIREKESN